MNIREDAQGRIEGTTVARMIMDFHREFRAIYGDDTMSSSLCAVGPLQSMIGLAIKNGWLRDGFVPAAPTERQIYDATR